MDGRVLAWLLLAWLLCAWLLAGVPSRSTSQPVSRFAANRCNRLNTRHMHEQSRTLKKTQKMIWIAICTST